MLPSSVQQLCTLSWNMSEIRSQKYSNNMPNLVRNSYVVEMCRTNRTHWFRRFTDYGRSNTRNDREFPCTGKGGAASRRSFSIKLLPKYIYGQ